MKHTLSFGTLTHPFARILGVTGLALGFSVIAEASTTQSRSSNILEQVEKGAYRALIKARLVDENASPSDLKNSVPVVDALGFTSDDLETGGTVKVRLENLAVLLADTVSNFEMLAGRVEEINQERMRDMNVFVERLNSIDAQLRRITSLVLTLGIMHQEILDENERTEADLCAIIQERTQKVLAVLPELTPGEPLYKDEIKNEVPDCGCAGGTGNEEEPSPDHEEEEEAVGGEGEPNA